MDGDEDDDEDDEDMMDDDEVMTTTSIGGTRRSVYVGSGLSVTNPIMAVGIPSIGPDGENIIEYEEGTIGPGGAPVSKHNPLGKSKGFLRRIANLPLIEESNRIQPTLHMYFV